jgi:tripartite-type tricarboxylate transporter receptor subunit TctC
MFDNMPSSLPLVKEGKLRALGVTSLKRSAAAPEIPTIAEQGLPGFDVKTWYGLYVPAHTPKAIMERLHEEIGKIAAIPAFRERLVGHGGEAVAIGPDAFKAQTERELKIWTTTIRTANIHME